MVGALAHSSKWPGVLCESMQQPHLADAQYQIAVKLGGLTADWRFDRMATVVPPGRSPPPTPRSPNTSACGSGRVRRDAATAKASWRRRTTRRRNGGGDRFPTRSPPPRRWHRWTSSARAQIADQRGRTDPDGNRCTVADLAAAEPLRPVPAAPPIAVFTAGRTASAQALVSFRGNRYSIPPGHAGQHVEVTHRLGAATLSITTSSAVTVAVHARRPDGAGTTVRAETHVTALNTAALAAFTTAAPHRLKQRIPPGPAARAAADLLRGVNTPAPSSSVIDLGQYAQAAARRRTLPADPELNPNPFEGDNTS